MTKQFIQILIFSAVSFSCREIEETTTTDVKYDEIKTVLKGEKNSTPISQSAAKDSIKTDLILEQDPPVKHGGHWRTK